MKKTPDAKSRWRRGEGASPTGSPIAAGSLLGCDGDAIERRGREGLGALDALLALSLDTFHLGLREQLIARLA